jgi:hypothetical protein
MQPFLAGSTTFEGIRLQAREEGSRIENNINIILDEQNFG